MSTPYSREAKRWATEIDFTCFKAAVERLKALSPLLPPGWQFTDEQLQRIAQVDEFTFLNAHIKELLDQGCDLNEARSLARGWTDSKIVTHLEFSDRVIAQPLSHKYPLLSPVNLQSYYLPLIANALARKGLPTFHNLMLDQVASAIGVDTSEAFALLTRNFLRDPYFLAKYVEEKIGVQRQTFFEEYQPESALAGEDRVTHLRARLRRNYLAVLDEWGIKPEVYEAYIQQRITTQVWGSSHGRVLDFITTDLSNKPLPLGEVSQARDLALRDLFADTFGLMVSFIDFNEHQQKRKFRQTVPDQIKRFKTSGEFKKGIASGDYLMNLAIADLALACGSFENAVALLFEANTIGGTEVKISPRVKAALHQCIEAYRAVNICQYLLVRLTTDPDFERRLELENVDQMLRHLYRPEDLAVELPYQVVQATLRTQSIEGIWDISTGTWGKNEHIVQTIDDQQPEAVRDSQSVLGVVRTKLHDVNTVEQPEILLLQQTAHLLTQARDFKRMIR